MLEENPEMPRVVLDASAILAVLFREPGAELVERYYPHAIVSSVNLSEVAAKLCDRGLAAGDVAGLLSGLDLDVRVFDETQALLAGSLREATRSQGLSIGDRACLALGITEGVAVVTTDRIWSVISHRIGVRVIVVR